MTQKALHILIERYFNAETTPQQERLMIREALLRQGQDPLADELLAVTAAARRRHSLKLPEGTPVRAAMRRTRRITLAAVSCAAIVALLWIPGRVRMNNSGHAEEYAFVNGVRTDNSESINAIISQQLSEMDGAGRNLEDAISSDLSDFSDFNDLDAEL